MIERMRIPFGVVGIILGIGFFIFGGDDLHYMWLSGFSIGWGITQTIVMLYLWSLE